MKPFTYKSWHAWIGSVGQIMLSDELNKNLYSFNSVDECINFLYSVPLRDDSKEAAKALDAHIKDWLKIIWTKVANDSNGNPRYVCHFLNLNTEKEKADIADVGQKYILAMARAKRIGGKKFSNKQYGGGIVFQSYSLDSTETAIKRIIQQEEINNGTN